jgi:hypothetical protein
MVLTMNFMQRVAELKQSLVALAKDSAKSFQKVVPDLSLDNAAGVRGVNETASLDHN